MHTTSSAATPTGGRIALALAAVYVIWGSTYLAIRFALEGGFPPFLLGGIRFLIAGSLMYAVLRWRGMRSPTRAQWGNALVLGILLMLLGNGMVNLAEQTVSSGLAAVAVARSRGARVCAVDVSAASLDRALDQGADEVVDASIGPDKVIAAVTHWAGGGVDVSIDALGSPEACRTGILSLGRRGRHVQVGLLPPAAGRADIPMERVIGWELDVLGSHGMAAADYPALLDDIASRRLDLRAMIAPGEPLGLEDAGSALVAMGSTPSRGIVLIDPTR